MRRDGESGHWMAPNWISRAAVVGVIALTGLALTATTAAAQSVPCGSRDKIIKKLSAQYSEAPIAMGLDASGKIVELLKAPAGSWTILITGPGGPTCVVAVGDNWEFLPAHTQIGGEPT